MQTIAKEYGRKSVLRSMGTWQVLTPKKMRETLAPLLDLNSVPQSLGGDASDDILSTPDGRISYPHFKQVRLAAPTLHRVSSPGFDTIGKTQATCRGQGAIYYSCFYRI